MTNLQPWLVLVAPGTALVLFLVKAVLDRRAAVHQPRQVGAREAALTISQLIDETQQDLAGAGALVDDEKFSELVGRWKTTAETVRHQLSPELASRVDALNELLASAQRLGLHQGSGWAQAVFLAAADITNRAVSEVQVKRPPPRIFPAQEQLRELLDKGQRLGTGVGELNRSVWSGMAEIDRQAAKRRTALAFVFGVVVATYVALVIALS